MADISVEKETGRSLTWLWALIALLAIIGLMAYLAVQTAGTTTEVATQEVTDISETTAGLAAFEGDSVVVSSARVVSVLGPRSVVAFTPSQTSLMMVLAQGAGMVDQSANGLNYRASGIVMPLSETSVQDWLADGTVEALHEEEAANRDFYLLVGEFEEVVDETADADTTAGADTTAATEAGEDVAEQN